MLICYSDRSCRESRSGESMAGETVLYGKEVLMKTTLGKAVESFLEDVLDPVEGRWESYFFRRGIGWPPISWRFIPSKDLRTLRP